MQHDAPKRLKSVKFSPATSESDSADEGSSRQSIKHRRPVRALKNASHLSIQPGLSNAHLVLRRYARLSEEASPNSLSDDEEQELLQSPKVGPSQPIDRYHPNLLDLCLLGLAPSCSSQLVSERRLRRWICVSCRDALQSLVSPSDALLAMCSSAAYGAKEGLGEHSKKLPAEVELDRLAKKWGVSTGIAHVMLHKGAVNAIYMQLMKPGLRFVYFCTLL